MTNIRKRLQVLERLSHARPTPSPLNQIWNVALQSLSDQDLALLTAITVRQAAPKKPIEMSERETAVVAACLDAQDRQARHMGFQSCAMAEQALGYRR